MMTMEQARKDVYAVISAIEKKCLAAGYDMRDLFELLAVIEGGTDPVSV